MKNKSKGILHKIEKFSVSVVLTRLIAFAMSIYFILNFKDDQNFYGIILFFFRVCYMYCNTKMFYNCNKVRN